MDPASTIGLVLACYQVASEIGCQCLRYVRGVRQSKDAVDLVFTRIQTFQLSLRHLQLMLANETEVSYDQNRLKVVQEVMESQSTSLEMCLKELEKIQHSLSKVGTGGRCRELLQMLAWPLKQEEVDKTLQTLGSFAAAVDSALAIDTSVTVRQIHSTSKTIEGNTKQLLSSSANAEAQQLQRDELRKQDEERREAMATREKILGWLAHPDVGEIHNAVSKARKSTETGRWFLEGSVFQEFKKTPRSVLWLHGDSGCGKSVLCSAIIDQLKIMCRDSPRYRLAYWYFSISDMRRRGLEDLMRALLAQLMPTSATLPPILDLWEAKNGGREAPTLPELISTFEQMLRDKPADKDPLDLFIILDALDEANEAEHADIVALLQRNILRLNVHIHVLVTSRSNSIVVEQGWDPMVNFFKVMIGRQNADEDILIHVIDRLENDEDLKKWPPGRLNNIKETLTSNGAGMFRWVDCQLQAIRRCRKPKDLTKVLAELPKDLHDLYARELAVVESYAVEDVRKLLLWMTFPRRPLTTGEVVEILAVDLKSDPPCFDEEDRMPRPEDILKLCGSLVSTNTTLDSRYSIGSGTDIRTFTAAHASVVDFLQAGRIRIGSETVVSFTNSAANLEMAETCLVYLLRLIEDEKPLTEMELLSFPFARLSARMWHTFYREVLMSPEQQELSMDRLRKLAMRLLRTPKTSIKWIRLCDPSIDSHSFRRNETQHRSAMPALYYAATLGLPDIVDCLIKAGHDVDVGRAWDRRTPLIGACRHGREKVVSVLLNNGANPNSPGICRERPLAIAMKYRHTGIFNILLNTKGIEVNALKRHRPDEGEAQPSPSGLGMRVFSDVEYDIRYDESIVQYPWNNEPAVLDTDLDDCGPDGQDQTLISVAAASGSLDFVKALLAAGANANIAGGFGGTALEIACRNGRVDLVQCLLEGGANPDLPSDQWGSPLQAACCSPLAVLTPESIATVKILLDAGVDIDRIGGPFETALIAACQHGHADFVRMLLDHGANPNIAKRSEHKKYNSNALETVCIMQEHEIVTLLLDKGADPNIHGGWNGSPLHAAFLTSNHAIIDMLLQRGADFKYQGGCYGTVFQAALVSRRAATIKKALQLDLSSNEKAGWLTCPLLQGTALKDSLESLSKHLRHRAKKRAPKWQQWADN